VLPYLNIPALHIGPLTFHPFGLLVAIGLLLGARTAIEFGVGRRGLDRGIMADLVAWIAIGGMVGGHVLQVLFYQPQQAIREPWTLLYIWSGLSSFGGFTGAVIAFFVWLHRRRITNGLVYADTIAFGLVPGWILGRLGCTVAHDHPGRLTHFPLAVNAARMWPAPIPPPEPTPWIYLSSPRVGTYGGIRFDLGLLELLFTVGVLFTTFLAMRHRERRRGRPYRDGTYLAVMMLLYAPVRFGLDFLRATDLPRSDARYFGLTPAQYGAIALLAGGLMIALRARRRPPEPDATSATPTAA
jgi:phosphatidylglycerol:prolipoprotein diacylglycerol transferase